MTDPGARTIIKQMIVPVMKNAVSEEVPAMRKNVVVFFALFLFYPCYAQTPASGSKNEKSKGVQQKEKVSVRGVLYVDETTPGAGAVEGRRAVRPVSRPAGSTAEASKPVYLPPRPADAPPPSGLGYTIFLETADGGFVRAPANRKFQTGEHIRFLFEPFIEGYLYIIHQENGGTPKLLFPDARLAQKHRVVPGNPVWIPAATEKFPFFVFEDVGRGKAGQVTENITVVLSRDDLGADAGSILTTLSAMGKDRLNVVADVLNDSGQSISEREKETIRTRGLSLGDAPQASVALLNVGAEPVVTAKISLVHVPK